MPVVIDSNVAVRLLTRRRPNPYAELWHGWQDSGIEIHSTLLLWWEATNAFHRMGCAGEFGELRPAELIELLSSLNIRYSDIRDDHAIAVGLAQDFRLPATYDAHYLALALRLGCDLWTTDKKLLTAVGHRLTWVRLVEG
jgi:predicted nucleic acid-binding protein